TPGVFQHRRRRPRKTDVGFRTADLRPGHGDPRRGAEGGGGLSRAARRRPGDRCDPLIPGPRERHQQRTKCSSVQITLGARVWFVATTKVLGGYDASNHRSRHRLDSLGRDHLWLRKDEAKALARGELSESLTRRLVRFHLVDSTRGEPPMWRADEVKE